MLFKELTQQAKLATSYFQDSEFSKLNQALAELHLAVNQESLKHPLELQILLNIELSDLIYVQNLIVKTTILVNFIGQIHKINFASRQSLVIATCLLTLELGQQGKYLSSLKGVQLIEQNLDKFALKAVRRGKTQNALDIDIMSLLCLLARLKSNRWQLNLEQDIVKLCIHLVISSFGTGKTTRQPLYQRLAQYDYANSAIEQDHIESSLTRALYSGLLTVDKTRNFTSILALSSDKITSLAYNKQNQSWYDSIEEQDLNDIDYLRGNYRLALCELEKIAQIRQEQTLIIETIELSQSDNRVFPVNSLLNTQLSLLESERQDRLFASLDDADEANTLLRNTVSMLMTQSRKVSSVKHAFAIAGAANFTNVFISSSLKAQFQQDKHLGQIQLEQMIKLATKVNLELVKLLKQDKALELNLVITVILLSLCTVPKVRYSMIAHQFQEIGTLHQFFAETDITKLKQLSLNIAKRWGCSAAVLYKLQNFYRCNESQSYKIKLSIDEEKSVNQIELALSLLFDFLSGQPQPHFFHLSQLIELDVPEDVNPQEFYQSLIEKVNPYCSLS